MSTTTLTLGTWRDLTPRPFMTLKEGKEAYRLACQIVFDNPFSREAKHSFPQIRVDWSLLSLVSWAYRLDCWFENNLTPAEQKLFLNTEFILP